MDYEEQLRRTSHEKNANHLAKHRRYTLDRFQSEFAKKFGSSIDYRMNRMYDILLGMKDDLEKRGLI